VTAQADAASVAAFITPTLKLPQGGTPSHQNFRESNSLHKECVLLFKIIENILLS